MSTAKVVTILHPSSAVNNIVNDASGNVAVGNNLTVAGTATLTGATTVGGVAVVAVAPGTSGNVLKSNGTAWVSSATTSSITSGTAVATTSGTAIDFTSIPSTVKRITVMLNGVSTNGTSRQQIQLGVSGTPETSGYTTMTGLISAQADNITRYAVISSGFPFSYTTYASAVYHGSFVFTLLGSNLWTCMGVNYNTDVSSTSMNMVAGSKSLAGTLNMVRITTVGGTDTFDAGSINIMYE